MKPKTTIWGNRKLVAHWPRLTRFYGLSPFEIARMPRWLIQLYLEDVQEIEAEEQLVRLQASDFPHLEQSDRDRIFRQIARQSGLEREEPEAIDLGVEGAAEVLGGIGIAVVMEDA